MPMTDSALGITMTATARLDNWRELCRALGIGEPAQRTLSDGALLFHAYCKWRNETPSRLYGDWSFAAWHSRQRRLFLARDQLGNSGLFYYCSPLLPLAGIPRQLDEQLIFASSMGIFVEPDDYDRTFWKEVRSLLPGHQLEVTLEDRSVTPYWQVSGLPQLSYNHEEEVLEGFMEHFQRGVRCRLRTVGEAASTLSSGLDSGLVTALAARELAE
jgi:asparagine synthase (glutamine-hydrolysing)